MQTDATGSHSAVADGNSLQTALFSLGYSDLVDRQIQNHVMAGFPLPPTLREDMISFSRNQMWSRVGDEFWTAGKDTVRDFTDMEGISTPGASFTSPRLARASPYPFESPKTVVNSTFEGTNYIYEGLPLDASTRWDFNKVALHPELVGRVVGEMEDQPIMNEWILTEQERFSSINPGPTRFNKELSLSLATSHPLHGTSIEEQGSELSSSGVMSYSLHKRHVGSDNTSCSSNNLSLNFNSYKPFPVATQLSGSRFFQAMQEILAEFASYALENCDQMSFSATGSDHRVSFSSSCTAGRGGTRNGFSDELDPNHTFLFHSNLSHEKEVESKKKHLLSLLQVVDDQYIQCLDEIHTVISAFHAVTELDPNLHARFALPTISLMYRNFKERIICHILAMGASHSEGDASENSSFETSFIQKQWALQQLKKRDHQLWRPQRGLPERSVSVLRAWMFQNFLHPYPKDAEKHLLALKSGLTRSQVSNWFINARVRLWKPMIEEMYAEMNRRKAQRNEVETNGSHKNHLRFESRRFAVD